MKIAIISGVAITTPPEDYGGLEQVAYNLADGLSRDYDITLIASKGSKVGNYDLMETVDPNYGLLNEYQSYEMYKDKLDGFDVIIDHTHSFYGYRIKQRNPKIKVIKVVHDLLPWSSAPPSNSYDVLVGVSQFHAQYLSVRYNTSVDYIYNGLNDRLGTNCPHKGHYLLFLSRIDPGKGVHKFIELSRFGYDMVIAGEDDPQRGINRDYRNYIINESNKRGIKYYGRVSERLKNDLICNASAVVVPLQTPYYEVFGLWMVESLLRGTMVITTDRGSPMEILNGTGIITKRGVGNAVKWYMTNKYNVGSIDDRINRGRYFSIANMLDSYRKLIERLIV